MRMSNDEKIKKINNDRLFMFEMVKERISKENYNLAESLNIATLVLRFDEENAKKYKAITKAKQLIFELTEEISKATSVEEVINLRKKINYYINIIKKELTKRNVEQQVFNEMYANVSHLRKNISMYISFLKRESILTEISSLHKNTDSLSPEDNSRFKKFLTNELNYNIRIIKNTGTNSEEKIDLEKEEKNQSPLIENIIFEDDNANQLPPNEKEEFVDGLIRDLSFELDGNCDNSHSEQSNDMSPRELFLEERIKKYNLLYGFATLLQYNDSFLKNFINLFRNIPRYSHNKKIIKTAERDYCIYYSGQDLEDFIEYSKKRNSIKVALEVIFKSSRLSKRETECLLNHEKCKEWIIAFRNPESYLDEFKTFPVKKLCNH